MIFESLKNLKNDFKKEPLVIDMDEASAKSVIDQFNEMKLGADAFIEKTNLSNKSMESYLHIAESGNATFAGFTQHVNTANNAIGLMGLKAKATTVFMNGLKIAASTTITMLVANLIGYAFTAIDSLIHRSEQLIEAAEEAKNKISELNDSFVDNGKTINDIKKRYAELAQGVNQLTGENVRLSTDSYEEFLSLSEQIVEIFPTIPYIMDDNGKAIVQLSGDVDTIVGSLDQLIKKEQELTNIQVAEELPTLFKGVKEQSKLYKEEIVDLKKQRDALLKGKDAFSKDDFFNDFVDGITNQYINITTNNSEKYAQMVKDYTNLLTKANIEYDIYNEDVSTDGTLDENGYLNNIFKSHIYIKPEMDTTEIENALGEAIRDLAEKYNTEIIKLQNSINTTIEKNQANWSGLTQGLLSWASSDDSFQIMSDDMQAVVQLMINGIDYDSIDFSSIADLQTHIQDNILTLFDGSLGLSDILEKKIMGLFNQGDLSDDEYINLVNGVIAEIQKHIDDNELEAEIDLSFLISDKEDAKKRVQSFVSQIGGVVEQYKLNRYIAEKGIDTQAEREQFLSVTETATTYLEAIKLYDQYLDDLTKKNPPLLFSEDNNKAIDAFQEKVQKVNGYLQGLNSESLSSTDVLDILQEFNIDPSTVDMSTNSFKGLKEQLQEIINLEFTNMQTLFSDLLAKGAITEETYNNLISMTQAFKESLVITDEFSSLSAGLTSIQSSYTALKETQDEAIASNKLSYDTIQELAGIYPELEKTFMDYLSGATDVTTVTDALEEAYQADLENYRSYYSAKHGYDEEFYDQIVANVPETVKARFSEYESDLENYTNLVVAKAQLEAGLEDKIFQKYLDDSLANGGVTTGMTLQLGRTFAKNEAQKLLAELKNATDLTITLPTITPSGSDSGSQDNVFDWAANSISNLNREIDNLNRKLEDASLEDKVQIYAELVEKNKELASATKQAASAYENDWNKKSSKLSSTYKNQIMSGTVFKLEDFSSEEKFKQVTEAQQAYEQWQSMLQTYLDTLKQQKSDEDAAIENDIAIAQQELDLIGSANLEGKTVKEKNKLLEREKELKYSILQSSLKLAKSEAERKQLQADYNNDEKDIAKRQYENARDGRNNRISYRESKIQDIQNKIDLAELQGGQGTKKQYTDMNNHLSAEIDWEQQNYDAAEVMRGTFKYGTAGWEKYNAEMQTAENNINACKKAQIENNRAILELPIKQYEDANKELQKQLDLQNENLAKIESAMSYAQTLIQDEIDALNDDKEAISDSYDERIKKIQEEKDAFTESNDELQRSIDLENAKYNLEKALRNKTVRVYRKGEGFVYESDQEEVRNAQSELDQQVYNNTVADFDKEIQTLTDEKEAKLEVLDDEIELWEDYAEQLEKVSGLYDRLEGQRNFLELFKSSGETAILNKDTGIIGQMGSELFSTKSEIDNLEGQIKANETTIAKIKEEAAGYLTTVEQVNEAQEKINAIILANEDEIEAIGTRTTKVNELKDKWDETETEVDLSLGGIETANIEAKDNESTIFEERENRLRQFRDEVVKLYGDIANAVTQANSSYAELQSTLAKATKAANDISDLNNGTTKPNNKTKVPTYHSGGIVGEPNKDKLPEHLVALTDANLKPNETLAKLLNGEVVLNPSQMDNLFANINRAFALTPLNKRENSPITVSIGDVNVYNPDNTDMIVNEIVKELPLKVVQRLHSK